MLCEHGYCGGLGRRKVAKLRRAWAGLRVGNRAWAVCESCADLLVRSLRAEGHFPSRISLSRVQQLRAVPVSVARKERGPSADAAMFPHEERPTIATRSKPAVRTEEPKPFLILGYEIKKRRLKTHARKGDKRSQFVRQRATSVEDCATRERDELRVKEILEGRRLAKSNTLLKARRNARQRKSAPKGRPT